jgi:hypothetical protein
MLGDDPRGRLRMALDAYFGPRAAAASRYEVREQVREPPALLAVAFETVAA